MKKLSDAITAMIDVDDGPEPTFTTQALELIRSHVLDLEARLVVTDEMVERASRTFMTGPRPSLGSLPRAQMRKALEAALNGDGS